MPSRRHSSATDTSPRTPSITMRILSSVGNLRRVARLILRISTRAVSAERVGPAISVGLLSGLFSSGLYHLCDCDLLLLPVRSFYVGEIPGLDRIHLLDPLSANRGPVAGGRSTRLLFSISLHLHRPV